MSGLTQATRGLLETTAALVTAGEIDQSTREKIDTAVMESAARKRTRMEFCDRHAPMFLEERVDRRAETMVEGGWSHGGPCEGGKCRLWPGRDFYVAEVCHGEMVLDWTDPS